MNGEQNGLHTFVCPSQNECSLATDVNDKKQYFVKNVVFPSFSKISRDLMDDHKELIFGLFLTCTDGEMTEIQQQANNQEFSVIPSKSVTSQNT